MVLFPKIQKKQHYSFSYVALFFVFFQNAQNVQKRFVFLCGTIFDFFQTAN